MPFIYEVNGQRVEFENEPTEKDIDEAAREMGSASTPAPSTAKTAAELAAPAITGVGMQELGVDAAALGKVAKPIIDTAIETYKGPMGVVRGVADATLMAHGVPPLAGAYGAAETLTKRAQALGSAAGEASKGLSQTPLTTAATGSTYPSGVPDYRTMGKAVPEAGALLKQAYDTGGPNAVKAFLQSPEAAQYMNNPAFREAAEAYAGKVPSLFSQAGKLVGPLARGAARVAGPAGMAMNLYDAGQTARETQLGQRLAEGQGKRAEQAFRGGMGMTYQGPQLGPQEAQNVLQSGSQRDIKYFGGQDALQQMIRKKAAEKVFGPVAPGSF